MNECLDKLLMKLPHLIDSLRSEEDTEGDLDLTSYISIVPFWFLTPQLRQRERDYYPMKQSILNISSYSDWNLCWEAKILRIREIMILFKF